MKCCSSMTYVRTWPAFAVLLVTLPMPCPTVAQEAIIIDHTCTDLSQVPDAWIAQAKSQFRLSYGHTSHGSQIITGMNMMKGDPGDLYWWDYDGTSGGLSLHDTTPPGDLGNPDRVRVAS